MRFARVYSGIRKVKIIILLGKEAEKAFIKLRDQYARAKKAMIGIFKSRTSIKATSKAKQKLTLLQFLQWLDDYIRPKNRKIILVNPTTLIMKKKLKVLAAIMLKKTMFSRRKDKS